MRASRVERRELELAGDQLVMIRWVLTAYAFCQQQQQQQQRPARRQLVPENAAASWTRVSERRYPSSSQTIGGLSAANRARQLPVCQAAGERAVDTLASLRPTDLASQIESSFKSNLEPKIERSQKQQPKPSLNASRIFDRRRWLSQ